MFNPKVIRGFPPNYAELCKVFHLAGRNDVIFAHGESIYVPNGRPLPLMLQVHERTHCERQLEIGVDLWWRAYIDDHEFRFREELLAHRAEYRAYCGGRKGQRQALETIARRLSGPLYANVCSIEQARELIVTND